MRTRTSRVTGCGRRWLAVAVAIAAAGCQTTVTRSIPTASSPPDPSSTADVRRAAATDAAPPAGDDDRRLSADDAVGGDASANRLHDIEGTLLMYFALHRRLPPTLDALRPLADADTDLQLTAPSGRPYLYAPGGLVAPGASKRILVADPAPSPRTRARQCILAPPAPPEAGAALSMEVVAVPEAAFKRYAPAD